MRSWSLMSGMGATVVVAGALIGLVGGSSGCGSSQLGDDETPTETPTPTPTPAPDPYIDQVIEVHYGGGAGYGQDRYPDVIFGPPLGVENAANGGSTDVLSLGVRGWIVVAFTDLEAVDGPGVDLIICENAFYVNGEPTQPWAEPAFVSVSDDGVTWHDFPCDPSAYPYAGCAGIYPVLSNPTDGIPANDPAVAGGDQYDLADVGLQTARFVKIVDAGLGEVAAPSSGFDLDAVVVVNAQKE